MGLVDEDPAAPPRVSPLSLSREIMGVERHVFRAGANKRVSQKPEQHSELDVHFSNVALHVSTVGAMVVGDGGVGIPGEGPGSLSPLSTGAAVVGGGDVGKLTGIGL